MKDFILAALPYILIGLSLAVLFANYRKGSERSEKNYLTEGMCIGICLGVALSTSLNLNLGFSISFGMLAGETAGMLLKKK
ncbi:MAG TPA: hypothetical protein IAB31_13345 [Candidatus Choladousia intestinavium]|uniref:Uncharacterized protein n=1 Tax=Candidatus Choladousia intestinavium TaxID=2840727 RepID=A0A9D1DAB2_9FIRM|nr:hypothetical protein [Candidatus Choladousia intestinavium]